MSELIIIEPVWQIKNWMQKPIFEKGQVAHIEDIGTCLFLEDCWAPMASEGKGNRAYANVEVLCANHEIEELEECAG